MKKKQQAACGKPRRTASGFNGKRGGQSRIARRAVATAPVF
jgi:hypothetical protein